MPNISNYIFEEHIKIHILEYLSRLHLNSNFKLDDCYMNMKKASISCVYLAISIVLYIKFVDEGKPQR